MIQFRFTIYKQKFDKFMDIIYDLVFIAANLPKPGKKWSLEDDEEEEEEDIKQKIEQNKIEDLDAIQEVEEEEEVDPLDAFMKVAVYMNLLHWFHSVIIVFAFPSFTKSC